MGTKTSVTLDTSVLLDILDHGPDSAFHRIIELHDLGRIEIAVSNRVRDPDTWKMHESQQNDLNRLLQLHRIGVRPAPFRLDISMVDGNDVLDGPRSIRPSYDLEKFRRIVGLDPAADLPHKKMNNQIGDYDALECHFLEMRDVFVTLDKRGYFTIEKRQMYERELGLLVWSPEQLIASLDQGDSQ